MTQQIKKYRRRVSDEQVERAKIALFKYEYPNGFPLMFGDYGGDLPESEHRILSGRARAVLEADAEVIEGVVQKAVDFYHGDYIRLLNPNTETYRELNYKTLEQFHAEWEEIQC